MAPLPTYYRGVPPDEGVYKQPPHAVLYKNEVLIKQLQHEKSTKCIRN